MDLKKDQKQAIVRKIVNQLEANNNEAIRLITEKHLKATKLTAEESKKALEDARRSKANREIDKVLSAAKLHRYPGYTQKVSDAIELMSIDATSLTEILNSLSKQFGVKLK